MPEKSGPVLTLVPGEMSRVWAKPGVVVEVERFLVELGQQVTMG